MKKIAHQYVTGTTPVKVTSQFGDADVFAASVINQKAVNQNTQQILVLVAVQVVSLIEAQFGFATNEDQDLIND